MKSPRLSGSLLRKIFVAASIRRWNDQATPIEFCELDKQAHKIIIAYFLARLQENKGAQIHWERLIQQFLFEFFERITLTDIKPPVFHELARTHNKQLVEFVMKNLEPELGEYEFFKQMGVYLSARNQANNDISRDKTHEKADKNLRQKFQNLEQEILKAAHYYASKWEFDIIYHFNPKMYDVRYIKEALDAQLESSFNLESVRELAFFKDMRELVTMLGQLRFQKRWSQTPRIPATSVLGHMLIVATSAYLLSLDLGACEKMRVNHFLCGLFHDLPEVLTRDIISPIKHTIAGLDTLIKDIEEHAVREKILSKVSENIARDIVYFTQDEFSNRYEVEHFRYEVGAQELFEKFNIDEFNPICGEFLKFCDHLSAFLEARISIAHGISSADLVNGANGIFEKCKDKSYNGVDVGKIIRDFV